jgi:hypothetical protein
MVAQDIDVQVEQQDVPGYYLSVGYISHDVEAICGGATAHQASLFVNHHPILRSTPKGVWLSKNFYKVEEEFFVLYKARKRNAYPTLVQAIESFKERKNHQQYHMRIRLERIDYCIDKITNDYDAVHAELKAQLHVPRSHQR